MSTKTNINTNVSMTDSTSKTTMSKFAFFAMTASLFITLYEYPTFAASGKTLIFFLMICGIFWFLPIALCSAELATMDGNQEGGIYSWVGKPLGEKFGFASLFFQWFQITVGFVTMIYFIIGTLAYSFDLPAINNNPIFKFLCVIGIFWILTILQFKGTQATAKLAKYGFSIGVILPVAIMLVLAIKYFMDGNPVSSNFTNSSFIPKGNEIAGLTSFILAYTGVEASATHFNDLDNPNKTYPKLLILLVIVGILMSTIGGSIVSMVLGGTISSSEGVMDAVTQLISPHHISFFVKSMGVLMAFGILAQVASWIVSPTEGLRFAATKGLLPDDFTKQNKAGVPVKILLIQGVIVTIWAALLTFGSGSSGGNIAYQSAISLTVLIYLIAYILFFVSYLVVVKKHKDVKRDFQIPGGNVVKYIVATVGLLISIFAVFTSFMVPPTIPESSSGSYLTMLAIAFVVVLSIPFIWYKFYSIPNKAKKVKEVMSNENAEKGIKEPTK